MKRNISKKMKTFVLFLLLFLTACSNKKSNTKESENISLNSETTLLDTSEETSLDNAQEYISEELETSTESEDSDIVDVWSIEDFHNDRAWVRYRIDDHEYWGCIDKSGNAISQYDGVAYHTPFEDGYAHMYTADTLYTIDLNGNITAEYTKNSDLICYEGGYVVMRTNESGFDSVGYTYKIFDPNGNLEKEIKSDAELDATSVRYCGKGVIWIRNYGYYLAKNKIFVETPGNFCTFQEDDDIAIIDTYFEDGKSTLVLLNLNGEITEYSSESFGSSIVESAIINNVCVVYDKDKKTFFSIDFSTGNLYQLAEEYVEKLDTEMSEYAGFDCYDGRISLRFKGADHKQYAIIFDKTLNPVFGPILDYGSHHYSDGLILISADGSAFMYDIDGNSVYSMSDIPYNTPIDARNRDVAYSCGALRLQDKEHNDVFVDTTGQVLFDKINFKNVPITNLKKS